jgi:cobalt/nickel transport system ATP-binding protein
LDWLLEFTDVHFTYPGARHQALAGLTMRIPAGQRCVLLGHNGSGKSTFFLHANGILRPEQGRIHWRGKPLGYDRSSLLVLRQAVGLVFQDPEQQLVAGTVGEDISYGLCNIGLDDREIVRRVREIAQRFDLEELLDRPIHQLSLGQKRQVALAGVMAMQPQLLLLDEPTACLDRLHTRQLMAELAEIHQAGTAILMATHDLDLAYAWADWIFVLDGGRLVLEGTPDQVFSQRAALEELHLGVPLLFDLWEALPPERRAAFTSGMPPRTAAEWKERKVWV